MRDRPIWLIRHHVGKREYWRAVWPDPDKPSGHGGKSLGNVEKVSRRQAMVRLRAVVFDMEKRKLAAGAVPRLSSWLETFIGLHVADVGDRTIRAYREAWAYLTEFLGDRALDRITRADAADWLAWMKKRGLAVNTIRKHIRVVKQAFSEAAGQDRILFSPFDRLAGAPVKTRKTWATITREDLDRILAACPHAGWRSLWALCRLAGLRVGEAMGLEWRDVDFSANSMAVNARLERDTTKRRRRVIPIEPAAAVTGLTAILLESQAGAPAGERLVCWGVDPDDANMRKRAAKILKAAHISGYAKPFHTLRKNREDELARVYPIHVVAEMQGHGIQVSADHYLRLPADAFGEAGVTKTVTKRPGVES